MRPVRSRSKWVVLLLSSLAVMSAHALRNSINPFMKYLTVKYQIPYAVAGGFITAFFLGYAVAQIPGGAWADRKGPFPVIVTGLSLLTAGTLAFGFAPSYVPAIVARFATGVGGGMMYSPAARLVADVFPKELRGRAFGVIESAIGVGMLIPLAIFPAFFSTVHPESLIAGMGVGLAVLLGAWLLAGSGGGLAPGGRAPSRSPASYARLFKDGNFWLVVGIGTTYLLPSNGLIAWLPTFFQQGVGFSPGQSGTLMATLIAALIVSSLIAGQWSDAIGKRTPVLMAGTVCLIFASLGFCAVRGFAGLAILTATTGVGQGLGFAIFGALASERFGTEVAASVISISSAIGQACSAMSGIVYGRLFDLTGAFTAVFLLTTAILALRLILGLAFVEDPESGSILRPRRPQAL